MTLEELRAHLDKGQQGLTFDIRHGVLWINANAGADAMTPVAMGSISVDPPRVRVAGSATLTGDPEMAMEELKVAQRMVQLLLHTRELLHLDSEAGERKTRRRTREAS